MILPGGFLRRLDADFIFRTDASTTIGFGHVMRCLSLADALSERGAKVAFVSREHHGSLCDLIAERGYLLARLPAPDSGIRFGNGLEYAAWLGAAWERDVAQTREAIRSFGMESPCLIIDHYAIDFRWEYALRDSARNIMVIDDLANRRHDCDMLLDQNYHPTPEERYEGRVPRYCRMLFGPRYALLRPEFARARASVCPRDGEVRRLFVFLGGTDAGNATERVIDAVRLARVPAHIEVDVVIGASHQARERLLSLANAESSIRCHVETSCMAELLARADLAIGAGGSATWERCALGVPTLAVCLADNQRELLHHGSRRGFVYVPDMDSTIDVAMLAEHLRALLANSGLRNLLSVAGMALVDGLGVERVATELLAAGIKIRRATQDDGDAILRWRNDPAVRNVSRSSEVIAPEQHQRWLADVLASTSRVLLIGEHDGAPIGVVRFDAENDSAEVSIYLKPSRIGRGEGVALLRAAEAWLRRECPTVTTLRAYVAARNMASQRIFERCGYLPESAQYAKRTAI